MITSHSLTPPLNKAEIIKIVLELIKIFVNVISGCSATHALLGK